MLELHQLRSFVAVARHENVSKAAVELGISQSPLSRQIIALEHNLGFALFVRAKQRLRLSVAGSQFLAEAKALLHKADLMEQRSRAIGEGRLGPLTLGYVPGAVYSGVLPKALRRVRRYAKKAQIHLLPLSSEGQWEALNQGDIDGGYAYRRPPKSMGFEAKLEVEEVFLVAAPAVAVNNGLSAAKQLFATYPLVAASSRAGSMAPIMEAVSALGYRIDVGTTAVDPAVALALVGAGEGIAIVQESLRKHAPKSVSFVPFPRRLSVRMSIYGIKRPGGSPLTKWL